MNPDFTEQAMAVQMDGRAKQLLLRRPTHRPPRPGLVVCLGLDRRRTLEGLPFRTLSDRLLAEGCCVAGIDLPYHGDEAGPDGTEGLAAIARAVAAGADPFGGFAALMVAALAVWRKEAGGRGPVATAGTSRGALFALHWAAADRRVRALALLSPVTRLEALDEFSGVAPAQQWQRLNALATVPALADRPVFVAINAEDPRVNTHFTDEFVASLRETSAAHPEYLRLPGLSHRASPEAYERAASFLLNHLSTSGAE